MYIIIGDIDRVVSADGARGVRRRPSAAAAAAAANHLAQLLVTLATCRRECDATAAAAAELSR